MRAIEAITKWNHFLFDAEPITVGQIGFSTNTANFGCSNC